MELVTWLAVLGSTAAAMAGARTFRRSQRRLRAEGFRRVAERADVHDLCVDDAGMLTGRYGPLAVRIRGDIGFASNVVHLAVSGLWADLVLSKPGVLRAVWRGDAESTLELGDPQLDGTIVLDAPSLGGRSLFDVVTRAKVLEVFGLGASVRVEAGELTARFQAPVGAAFDERALSALLDLARRLRPPESPLTRLVQISHADPLSTVRALALRTLQALEPRPPETVQALRIATGDASPALRLQAARALGDDGVPTLLALADDFAVDDAISGEALAVLGDRCTVDEARPILERAVATSRVACAQAALAVVARGGADEVELIADALARAHEPIKAAAAAALGTIASPSTIPPLRAALRAESMTVASAAARALGAFATVAEVPALREAEKRGGVLGAAARTAIASIQSRLPGATPGQVSLAGAAGEVSVVESADGRLSWQRDE